ncbi:MAG: hypothetical protein IPK14_03515 [Blastocatellia bacterium]|nr:hypothetical protein [Blastocatellia bacterium]
MEQLTLILQLQWLLFKNSLKSQSSKIELVARIIFVIGSAIVDIAIAVGLFMATLLLYNHPSMIKAFIYLFLGITLYWQVIPLVTASFGSGLSISNFRLYPISDKKLLFLDLFSGATDLTSLSLYLPLLGILIGSIIISPLYSPILIILFALFILFNIALSRYLQRILEKLFAHRRIKEIMVFIVLFIFISISFAPMIFFRQEMRQTQSKQIPTKEQTIKNSPKVFLLKENLPSSETIVQVLKWSPPGLIARAAINFPKETISNKFSIILLLFLFSGGCLLLVQRKINYEFYGVGSKTLLPNKTPITKVKANTNKTFAKNVFANNWFNLLPLQAVIVLEKEIKYFYRSSKMLLLFVSGILGAIPFPFIFQIEPPTESSSIFKHFVLPGISFYSLMVIGQFFVNSFGFDSHGVKTFFLMPIRGKNVLLGKNLSIFLITLIQISIMLILFHYVIYPISLYILLNTVLSTMIALLAYIILGNLLSIFYPYKMDFSSLSNNNYSKMAMLLMTLLQGFVFSLLAIAPVTAWYYKTAWLSYPVFVTELIFMLAIYKISLNFAGDLFEKRVEQFLQMLL